MSCKKIYIFLFLVSTLLFPAFVSAQTNVNVNAQNQSNNVYQFSLIQNAAAPGQKTLERWSEDQITGSLMAVLRAFIGKIPDEFFAALEKLTTDGTGKIPKIYPSGAIGKGNEMIAVLFTPPASGIEYIAQVKDSFLGKPAYAQGFGFKGLEFLLPLWKAARNIVYVLSSIIFVVIGLMIILRVKVSPQAVVTIQSAIPQVITTLILVTFSYAIAGLMIDLGNLISGIVIAIIFNSQGKGLNQQIFDPIYQSSAGIPILSDLGQLIQQVFNTITQIKPLSFTNLVNPDINTLNMLSFRAAPHWISLMLLGGLLGSVITGVFLGSIGNIVGGIGNSILSGLGGVAGGIGGGLIGGLIIPIVICIAIGIWLIKLYFGLIKVYVTIIFKIISGPLEIAMGAFPNSKSGFSSWLLEVFANIMVFPIVTIFLIIVNIITDSIAMTATQPNGLIWVPGLINAGNQLYPTILSAFVGLAGLALISKLPDMIPQYVFMIKPSPFGQAIGQNLANPPLVGGLSKNTQAAVDKAVQGAVGAGLGFVAGKTGLSNSPQGRETRAQ